MPCQVNSALRAPQNTQGSDGARKITYLSAAISGPTAPPERNAVRQLSESAARLPSAQAARIWVPVLLWSCKCRMRRGAAARMWCVSAASSPAGEPHGYRPAVRGVARGGWFAPAEAMLVMHKAASCCTAASTPGCSIAHRGSITPICSIWLAGGMSVAARGLAPGEMLPVSRDPRQATHLYSRSAAAGRGPRRCWPGQR
jgi:hypothetical protein